MTMTTVIKHGIILEKTDLAFEDCGVLNPAVIMDVNGKIDFLYRAVRVGNYSSIGYCKLGEFNKIETRFTQPIILPGHEYEKHGIEDPRVVRIDNLYYITYTAYDGNNAIGALATSTDLKEFTKLGLISPRFTYKDFAVCVESNKNINEKHLRFYKIFKERVGAVRSDELLVWDKDVVFFPRKINGKFTFLHRLYPSIQIASFEKIEELTEEFWRTYLFNLQNYIVLESKYHFEAAYIGGGCPPIETEDGWLIIYHGVEDTSKGYVYHATAALLDIEDPHKEIGRLSRPLFSPTEEWEREGYVKNVVFPSGAIVKGDELFIYYGAADSRIAVASVNLKYLLYELKNETSQTR